MEIFGHREIDAESSGGCDYPNCSRLPPNNGHTWLLAILGSWRFWALGDSGLLAILGRYLQNSVRMLADSTTAEKHFA